MSKLGWRLRAASFLGLAAMVFLAAGCGEDAVTNGFTGYNGQVSEMGIDLSLEDGGMSASAEKPGFGDSYFATYLDDGREVDITDDPLATDQRLVDVENHADVEVKYLRVVWGNMSRGPEADDTHSDCEIINWTGGATISDGLLMPLRTIRFERNDYIIPPWRQDDPSRQKVLWVSHTGPGKDGILFKIVVPAADDATLDGDTTLRSNGDGLTEDDMFYFKAAGLELAFPLSEIQDLEKLVMLDEYNGVSFVGFDREDLDDLCPRGTMEGAWVRVENDDHLGGYFRAKWVGALGRAMGHVRGRWGVLPEGEQVFVGKIIGRNGQYLGHLRGHWARSDGDPRHGSFTGAWVIHREDGSFEVRGGLRGEWGISDRVEDGGFLRAVWRANCNRDGEGDTGA